LIAPLPPGADPPDLAAAKQALRGMMRARRAECDPALGELLANHLLATPMLAARLEVGTVVAGFLPLPGEIDMLPALRRLAARGCKIALPVTPPAGQALRFRQWRPGAVLLRGRFGTWAPLGPLLTPAMLLVPLLAFDRRGHRLGYGGGYYDRTQAALPGTLAIGCGFAVQELDEVPAGPYDARLALVATECGVIGCR
jgi:5-formyltetrahydrofolate cyclo-ligase